MVGLVALFKKPAFLKGNRVIILAGKHAGRVGYVVEDSPLKAQSPFEVSVVLEDPTGLGIQSIVKIEDSDLLKKK